MRTIDHEEDAVAEKQDLLSEMSFVEEDKDLVIEKSELTRRKTTLNLICLTLGLGG